MTEAGDIYPVLAEKYGLTVEQVRNIIIYFWRNGVKRSLENMVSDEIYVSKLGSFKIKDWKLKYSIPISYALSKRENLHERNIEYFTKLNTQLIEIEKVVQSKNEKYSEFSKKNSRDIQKQDSDIRGSEEQSD